LETQVVGCVHDFVEEFANYFVAQGGDAIFFLCLSSSQIMRAPV